MLRGFEPRTPSRAAKCSAASRHPHRCVTPVWTLAMRAKEPDTLVMVTLGGALSRIGLTSTQPGVTM